MSILIRGMKMPSKCQCCGLLRYYHENGNVWCNASNKLMMEQAWFEKIDIDRPDWCPLIELPEERTQERTETHACELISRQAAIDRAVSIPMFGRDVKMVAVSEIKNLPSAQPVLDRTKISDLLEKIYSIQSAYLSVEGVLARKYYCKQLWIELFGSEDVPTWMD